MQSIKPVDFTLFVGKTTSFTLSSGKVVKVRESNGSDDELLSSMDLLLQGDNIDQYLTSVIELDEDLGRKPLFDEVQAYKEMDRFYLLYQYLVWKNGTTLEAEVSCQNVGCEEGRT